MARWTIETDTVILKNVSPVGMMMWDSRDENGNRKYALADIRRAEPDAVLTVK